ncbi:MAG TPA: response regulator transcription factor [Chitinophagales bacterium]|nr:response regulator transcription factor [Chitinophagales bacterium]
MQIKIALTDDHQLVRSGIKMLIENFPEFKVVVEASNGKELLEKLALLKVLPEIAMVDVAMPVMDGFETTRELIRQYPKLRVVALSVHDDLQSVNSMIESGANAYLLKDSSPQIVRNTLQQVFEKGYYYDKFVIESLMKARQKQQDDELKKNNRSGRNSGIDPASLLTVREIEFMKHSCSELTYKEIADLMEVSLRTVDGYRESVFSKLDLKSRTGIVLYAIHKGLAQ